ncbi:hypothetical protein [Paracoccus sediminilitoris]|uniref:hypothetical protein n=1 Tax=Paracoccus sediminilitoris TaxID=2202419 RepID=UPI00272C7C83|nr:hypothetical protein [Paracoccus sediminilitoris]
MRGLQKYPVGLFGTPQSDAGSSDETPRGITIANIHTVRSTGRTGYPSTYHGRRDHPHLSQIGHEAFHAIKPVVEPACGVPLHVGRLSVIPKIACDDGQNWTVRRVHPVKDLVRHLIAAIKPIQCGVQWSGFGGGVQLQNNIAFGIGAAQFR